MALGKCVNISKPCSKAINREEIEADKSNFVCPECGKPLVEIKDKKKVKTGDEPINWKLIAGIIAAVVVLAGACIVYFFTPVGSMVKTLFGKDGDGENVEMVYIEEIKFTDGQETTLSIGDTKQLNYTIQPEQNDEDIVWHSSEPSVATVDANGLVSALKEGSSIISINAQGAAASITVNVKGNLKPGPRKIEYGYATYNGDIRNGKPDGNGVLEFKKDYTYKVGQKEYEIKAGEHITGMFRDGKLNLGTWYQKDGNETVIKQ